MIDLALVVKVFAAVAGGVTVLAAVAAFLWWLVSQSRGLGRVEQKIDTLVEDNKEQRVSLAQVRDELAEIRGERRAEARAHAAE